MALNGLSSDDAPLRNCSLAHSSAFLETKKRKVVFILPSWAFARVSDSGRYSSRHEWTRACWDICRRRDNVNRLFIKARPSTVRTLAIR